MSTLYRQHNLLFLVGKVKVKDQLIDTDDGIKFPKKKRCKMEA